MTDCVCFFFQVACKKKKGASDVERGGKKFKFPLQKKTILFGALFPPSLCDHTEEVEAHVSWR